MMEKFGTILTSAGLEAITACMVAGTKLNITHMAVGDSNGAYYDPTEAQTALRREKWRGAAVVSAVTGNARRIVVTAVIPSTVGGFDIREAGVFDDRGRMIAVTKYALTEKPDPSSGAAKDTHIQLVVDVVNAGSVSITVDPSAAFVLQREFKQHTDARDIHVTQDEKQRWDGKAEGNHNHNAQYAGINHNHTAQDVGASPANHNHDGRYATAAQGTKADAAMPRGGGTFNYGVNLSAHYQDIWTPQVRNIQFSQSAPTGGIEGAVWHQYK